MGALTEGCLEGGKRRCYKGFLHVIGQASPAGATGMVNRLCTAGVSVSAVKGRAVQSLRVRVSKNARAAGYHNLELSSLCSITRH